MLLSVAACLAVGLWLLRGEPAAEPSPAGAAAATARASSAARAARQAVPGGTRSEVPASRPASATRPALEVRVVAKATGAPVAGATVACVARQEDLPAVAPHDRSVRDHEELAERFGRRCRADAAGVASIERPADWVVVTARLGESYGETVLDPRAPPPLVVALATDLTLRIQVRDGLGAPCAGVEVQEAIEREGKPEPLVASFGTTAGPEGMLVVRHLQLVHVPWFDDGARVVGSSAFANVLGAAPAAVRFDRFHPPPEPLQLRLPECGSVLVRLVDGSGRPFAPASGFVELYARPPGVGPSPRPHPSWSRFCDGSRSEFRFEHVGVGLLVRVRADVAGSALAAEEVLGPQRAGEGVELVLRPSTEGPVLRGRALDAGGAPLAKGALRVDFAGTAPARCVRGVATDERGAFECALGAGWDGVRATALVWLAHDGHGATGLVARTEPAPRLMPGVVELGDLRFSEAPLLAAGEVVDSRGAPLVSARVELVARATAREPFTRAGEGDGVAARHERGAFSFRGELERQELAVRVDCDGYLPLPPVPCARGTQDLRIVLGRAGSLEGKLLHDDVAHLLRLRVVEEKLGAEPRSGELIFTREPNVAWFGCSELPPGRYRLDFLLLADKAPLATLQDVAVREGASSDDPRLPSVDLRGKVPRVKLTFTRPDGEPAGDADGAVFVDGQEGPRRVGFAIEHGGCTVTARALPVDLLLSVRGHAAQVLRGVTADTTVRLEPLPRVRIEVLGIAADLLGPVDLKIALRRAGAPAPGQEVEVHHAGWMVNVRQGALPADQLDASSAGSKLQFVAPVQGDGEYVVECRIAATGPGPVREVPLTRASPQAITVRASAPRPYAVALDPAEVAAAIQQTRR